MATPQYHQYPDGSKARLVGRELTITDAGMKLVVKQARNGYFRRTIQSRSYSLGKDWKNAYPRLLELQRSADESPQQVCHKGLTIEGMCTQHNTDKPPI